MPVQSRARQNDHFPDRAGHAHRANRIARTLYVVYPTEVWYCTEAPAHTVWAGPDLARVETEDAVDERGVRDARNTRGQRRSEARPSEDGPSLVVLSGAPLADRSRCCCRRHDGFRPEGRRWFRPSLSALIVVMALVYVGAAALGRRSASWVVLLAGLPVAFFVPSTLGINPSVILLLAAAFFLVVGAVRGRSREAGGLALQAAGVLVFGAMSLAALSVTPSSASTSWPSPSSATPPGMPSTTCGTGWSRVRTRSSAASWTSCSAWLSSFWRSRRRAGVHANLRAYPLPHVRYSAGEDVPLAEKLSTSVSTLRRAMLAPVLPRAGRALSL